MAKTKTERSDGWSVVDKRRSSDGYIYISLNIILYISVVITLAEYLSQAIKHIHTV